jgi:hypothetical protein
MGWLGLMRAAGMLTVLAGLVIGVLAALWPVNLTVFGTSASCGLTVVVAVAPAPAGWPDR